MYRITILHKETRLVRTFVCKSSIKNDRVAILPTKFVEKGYITGEEWAHSHQLISEKLGLFITEEKIDGRSKRAKEMLSFSWLYVFRIIEQEKNKAPFEPHGYIVISNSDACRMEIETNNDATEVRYRYVDVNGIAKEMPSNWIKIQHDSEGNPFFCTSTFGSRRFYLGVFMKL